VLFAVSSSAFAVFGIQHTRTLNFVREAASGGVVYIAKQCARAVMGFSHAVGGEINEL
jgi:hypothetical protein